MYDNTLQHVRRRSETAVNRPLGVRIGGIIQRTISKPTQSDNADEDTRLLLLQAPDLFRSLRERGGAQIVAPRAGAAELTGKGKRAMEAI